MQKVADTLVLLGSGNTVRDKSLQQKMYLHQYRWLVQTQHVNSIAGKDNWRLTLENKKESMEQVYILELCIQQKFRNGWIPWIELHTNPESVTGYRVYSLREFRKHQVTGWLYGQPKTETSRTRYFEYVLSYLLQELSKATDENHPGDIVTAWIIELFFEMVLARSVRKIPTSLCHETQSGMGPLSGRCEEIDNGITLVAVITVVTFIPILLTPLVCSQFLKALRYALT